MLTQTAIRSGFNRQPTRSASPSVPVVDSWLDRADGRGRCRFDRNVEIYGEDEPADYVYKVVSGAVRTYKVLSDGRRQIGAFYLPGDIFGLEIGDEHSFSAEAIVDSSVLVIKRSAVVALASATTMSPASCGR